MAEVSCATIAMIESVPLSTMVADMLRKAIINGKMKPGAPIIEMALAEQLNISRSPVREAIQILQSDGLIETVPYKGKRVKPLTPKEVEELYSLREQFEAFAVRRILESGVDVSVLNEHCAAMEKAAQADDFEALMEADEAFHRAIIRLADHQILLTMWDNLFLRIHQIMALRNRANRDLSKVGLNHPPIVRAMEERDFIKAMSLISDHTRSAADLKLNAQLFET